MSGALAFAALGLSAAPAPAAALPKTHDCAHQPSNEEQLRKEAAAQAGSMPGTEPLKD